MAVRAGASMAVESSAAGDQELVTKTLQIEHKLFYLDLKENPRGRYLKISEKTSGARSTIIVPIAGVVWFVDLFNYYANGDDNDLSSKELQLDTKVRTTHPPPHSPEPCAPCAIVLQFVAVLKSALALG